MTLVNIDLKNAGYEAGPDDRVIFYSLLVREGEFGTISTAPVEVELTDGQATVDLAPGPVGVQIIAGQVADTRIKIGEVPPSGPTTLNAVMMVTPAYTPALQAQFLKAIQDAQAQAITDLERSLDGALSQYRDYAVEAINVATNVDQRVAALESREGLAPESPTDGQTANLVTQPETLTHAAVRSIASDVAATATSQKLDYILSRSTQKAFTPPPGFTGFTDVQAMRTPWGEVTTDMDIEALHVPGSGATIYVDPVAGLDVASRTGLSWEDAYKSAAYAGQKLGAGLGHLIVRGGLYERVAGVTALRSGNIRISAAPGERVAFACADRSTAWAQHSGSCYKAAFSNCVGVLDMLGRDFASGADPDLYVEATSIEQVIATPGAWFSASGTVYVHRADSTAPDADVLVSRNLASVSFFSGAVTAPPSAFFDGVEFWGGTGGNMTCPSGHEVSSRVLGRNARFAFGGGANGLSVWGMERSVMVGCTADRNKMDGFNYHVAGGMHPAAVEINCTGSHNGTGPGSHNGSTAHDAVKITRIGGKYFNNAGANVADVNQVQSWNVACHAGESWDYKQDFMTNETARMWLEECVAESATGFVARDSSALKTRASYAEGSVEGNVTKW